MAERTGTPRYYDSILDTIGNTPLVKLKRMAKGLQCLVLLKIESFNPAGGVKDRIGVAMIEEAEKKGKLKRGGTVVEATSGNTGIALAAACAVKGYKCILTMPDNTGKEIIDMVRAYGAEVHLAPATAKYESPESYFGLATRIQAKIPNSILTDQQFNAVNPEAHYRSTGPEIWEQTGGAIDYFVCGMGTCGTISGAGKYLKEQKPSVKVIGVDPEGSIFANYINKNRSLDFKPKVSVVQGIGHKYIPGALWPEYIDRVVTVSQTDSFNTARALARNEGILAGSSAGCALAGGLRVAQRLGKNKTVLVLIPDDGSHYLSTIYNDEWMERGGYEIGKIGNRR